MHKTSRRQFLKVSAGMGAAAMLAACAPVATESDAGMADAMEEPIDLVVWYQDWDGANRIMGWVQPEFEKDHENVTVDLQAIGYGDLLNKMLPSIASGTEGRRHDDVHRLGRRHRHHPRLPRHHRRRRRRCRARRKDVAGRLPGRRSARQQGLLPALAGRHPRRRHDRQHGPLRRSRYRLPQLRDLRRCD